MSGSLPPHAAAQVQLCVFRVGDESYAVDIMRVREIIQPVSVKAVPGAPEYVEGVVALRGAVIPIVDLRRRFGLPKATRTRRTKFVICRVGNRHVGLSVDAVEGVVRVARSALKPPPAVFDSGPGRYLAGVAGGDGPVRFLLDVRALFEEAGRAGLERAAD